MTCKGFKSFYFNLKTLPASVPWVLICWFRDRLIRSSSIDLCKTDLSQTNTGNRTAVGRITFPRRSMLCQREVLKNLELLVIKKPTLLSQNQFCIVFCAVVETVNCRSPSEHLVQMKIQLSGYDWPYLRLCLVYTYADSRHLEATEHYVDYESKWRASAIWCVL